jgi:hypothetical protein
MRKQCHVLNGDSLKDQFPRSIDGEIVVVRECLVEGSVEGQNPDQLFVSRSNFLRESYGVSEQEYYDRVASEFIKLLSVADTDINLWFEDDLFCQVNLWFVSYLLKEKNNNPGNKVFLIRPIKHTQYGFGGLKESELISIYKGKQELLVLDKISKLWESYQSKDFEEMRSIATQIEEKYPFITEAVEAHIQRLPGEGRLGRPADSLIAIMRELKTDDFGLVYREFSNRESIYGFGDLQVRRLYDQIKDL